MRTVNKFIFLLCLLMFSACKKYPENTLWFKKPETLINNNWILDKFIVNNIDSTYFDALKMYRERGVSFQDDDVVFSEQYQGSWKIVNKKKYIEIGAYSSGNLVSFSPQKNIFRNYLRWKIEKLNTTQFWLSTVSDNIKYEIHFK